MVLSKEILPKFYNVKAHFGLNDYQTMELIKLDKWLIHKLDYIIENLDDETIDHLLFVNENWKDK